MNSSCDCIYVIVKLRLAPSCLVSCEIVEVFVIAPVAVILPSVWTFLLPHPGARNTIQIHKCKPPHIYDTDYHKTSFSNLYQYLRDGHSFSATMAYLCNATNTDVSLLYLENIILK